MASSFDTVRSISSVSRMTGVEVAASKKMTLNSSISLSRIFSMISAVSRWFFSTSLFFLASTTSLNTARPTSSLGATGISLTPAALSLAMMPFVSLAPSRTRFLPPLSTTSVERAFPDGSRVQLAHQLPLATRISSTGNTFSAGRRSKIRRP